MIQLSKILLMSLFAIGAFLTTTAFTNSQSDDLKTFEMNSSENSCTLYVKTSYGSTARSIKVSTDVSGGVSCVGGRSFYTDSDGEVTLKWVSGCYLRKIYVDGRGYEVDYKDGNSYTITMR